MGELLGGRLFGGQLSVGQKSFCPKSLHEQKLFRTKFRPGISGFGFPKSFISSEKNVSKCLKFLPWTKKFLIENSFDAINFLRKNMSSLGFCQFGQCGPMQPLRAMPPVRPKLPMGPRPTSTPPIVAIQAHDWQRIEPK